MTIPRAKLSYLFIVFFSITSFFMNTKFNIIISFILLGINIWNVYRCRKNWLLLMIMMFILYFNYSICIANYIQPIDTIYTQPSMIGDYASDVSLRCLFLFSSLLSLYLPKKIVKMNISNVFLENRHTSKLISIGIIFILFILTVLSLKISIGQEVRQESSSIFEYSMILTLIGFYYAGSNKYYRLILIILSSGLAFSTILNGDRITSLIIFVCLYLVCMSNRYSLYQVLPIGIVGLLLFTSIGQLRNDFSFSINNIMKAFGSLIDTRLANDTSYAAYYSSMSFLSFAETIDVNARFMFFLRFLLSIVFGSSISNSNLTLYVQRYFRWQGGGGLFPVYSYFYLGIIGVFIFSAIFIVIFKYANKKNINKEVICYLIFVCSMTPRWYLYTPTNLFRSLLIMWIVFKLFKIIDHYLLKNG